ncbi:MAG: hypothetical protein ACOYKE_06335 [Ferruginibacter sp.]
MRKLIVFLFFISLNVAAFATIKTWTGPSTGGSWSSAGNWTNGVPNNVNDTIVFDGSLVASITITDVAAFTSSWSFNALRLINNVTVNLSSASPTYLYLYKNFEINAGSRLNIGASTTNLFVVGGSNLLANFINIDGILDLQGTGIGNSFRTGFEPASFFTVIATTKVRGKIILSGKSAVITNGNTNNLVFENGATLNVTRDGGAVPNATYSDGSTIKVEGVINSITSFNSSAIYNGVIDWNCAAQAISGAPANILPSASYTWDSLIINNTNTGTVRLTTNPLNYLVKNLIVNNGTIELGGPTGSSAYAGRIDSLIQNGGTIIGNGTNGGGEVSFVADTIKISGKFIQNGGTFNFSNRTPSNGSPDASCILKVAGNLFIGGTVTNTQPVFAPNCAIEFNGSTTQNLSITGTYSNKIKTVVNNSAPLSGVNLVTAVQLPDSLVFYKGYIFLNNFNLTNLFPVQLGTTNFLAHVVTNGNGLFIQKNVGTTLIGLPIGASTTTFNPLSVNFISGSIDLGAKVDVGLNPTVQFPSIAVNRTWRIKPLATPPSDLLIGFGYSDLGVGLGDGNSGFSYTANDEVGLHDGVNWTIISAPGGVVPVGTNPYAVSSLVLASTLAANLLTPLAIGNLTAITAFNNTIDFKAIKQNNTALLKWNASSVDNVVAFEILKSNTGRNFESIAQLPVINGQVQYSYLDQNLWSGINYYRIKMTDDRGRITYSIIVTVLNKETGVQLTAALPSVFQQQTTLMITAAKSTAMQIVVTDALGKQVYTQKITLVAGSNTVAINCGHLASGNYQITGYYDGLKSNVIRIIKE